jgi:hypothetical protein
MGIPEGCAGAFALRTPKYADGSAVCDIIEVYRMEEIGMLLKISITYCTV